MLTSKDKLASNKSQRQDRKGVTAIVTGDPWTALAAAIVLQAARDAQAGSLEAAAWLLEDASLWLDFLGLDIHPDRVRRWVLAGCPGKQRVRRYVRS